ncbi:Acetylcholinesterase [Dactylella cylindrospora]|nr:Acetylcholinesterase [Dactylella cylindrospora]
MIALSVLLLLCSSLRSVFAQDVQRPVARPQGTPHLGPTVKISNGTVKGIYSEPYQQDFFLGVPYAKPPVGSLRFRPPRFIDTALGDIDATKYGKHCYGYGPDSVNYTQSEDCLTLNIIRPSNTPPTSKLPVAVWIHGGGFYMGGAPDLRYNLTFLVQQSVSLRTPIIAVSLNYRLSAWGFLGGRLAAGTENTNLGLKDQRMALKWVQENIASFGGDPKKVTVFGESAGGMSIGLQMIAYGGRDEGLFSGAVMQSGAPVYFTKTISPESVQPVVDEMVAEVGCADAADAMECLRSVEVGKLDKFLRGTSAGGPPRALAFQPMVDGGFVQGFGSHLLKNGRYVKVPTIIGVTSDEGTSFAGLIPGATESREGLVRWLSFFTHLSNTAINRVLELYNESASIPPKKDLDGVQTPPSLGTQFHRLAAIAGDLLMEANKRFTAKTLSSHGVPVWTYRHKAIENGSPAYLGAGHFSEVAFVFNNKNGHGYAVNPLGGTKANEYQELSDFMSKSWIRFIVTGNPNGKGRPVAGIEWSKYSEGSGMKQIVFELKSAGGLRIETDDYRKDGIDMFNEYALQIGR